MLSFSHISLSCVINLLYLLALLRKHNALFQACKPSTVLLNDLNDNRTACSRICKIVQQRRGASINNLIC